MLFNDTGMIAKIIKTIIEIVGFIVWVEFLKDSARDIIITIQEEREGCGDADFDDSC